MEFKKRYGLINSAKKLQDVAIEFNHLCARDCLEDLISTLEKTTCEQGYHSMPGYCKDENNEVHWSCLECGFSEAGEPTKLEKELHSLWQSSQKRGSA